MKEFLPFECGLPEKRNPAPMTARRRRRHRSDAPILPPPSIYMRVWKNLKRWLFQLPARTADSVILFSLRWLLVTACLSCVGYGHTFITKPPHLDTCTPTEVSRGGWLSQLCYERP